MSYKVGLGRYQRDAIRFVKSAEKSLISCGFHDFEVFFGNFVLVFYNSLDESVDPNMKNRLDTHIKVHHLQETFSSCALTELNSIKHRYKKMFLNLPISEIKSDLKEMCESAEYDDLNSWKSALYRALLRQVEEYRICLNHI